MLNKELMIKLQEEMTDIQNVKKLLMITKKEERREIKTEIQFLN